MGLIWVCNNKIITIKGTELIFYCLKKTNKDCSRIFLFLQYMSAMKFLLANNYYSSLISLVVSQFCHISHLCSSSLEEFSTHNFQGGWEWYSACDSAQTRWFNSLQRDIRVFISREQTCPFSLDDFYFRLMETTKTGKNKHRSLGRAQCVTHGWELAQQQFGGGGQVCSGSCTSQELLPRLPLHLAKGTGACSGWDGKVSGWPRGMGLMASKTLGD